MRSMGMDELLLLILLLYAVHSCVRALFYFFFHHRHQTAPTISGFGFCFLLLFIRFAFRRLKLIAARLSEACKIYLHNAIVVRAPARKRNKTNYV